MEEKWIEKIYVYLKTAYPMDYKEVSENDFYYSWNKILRHLGEEKVKPALIAWIKANSQPPEPFEFLKMVDMEEYEKLQEWYI